MTILLAALVCFLWLRVALDKPDAHNAALWGGLLGTNLAFAIDRTSKWLEERAYRRTP
jgi:hypothetical protein